ncbi:hypothetical protein OAJ57_03030 [Alphaproteobacteria bacterium]|nr:hypothetical protein [Alphaproteobacteria bacterium]
MNVLAAFVQNIDMLDASIERSVAWLMLAMVPITFSVAVLLYECSLALLCLQKSCVWLHGIVFLMGAGYRLLHNGHVRVGVFQRPASECHKAWVDLFGGYFLLLPLAIVTQYFSWNYVMNS